LKKDFVNNIFNKLMNIIFNFKLLVINKNGDTYLTDNKDKIVTESNGTFTISNLGMMGITRFDAIVNVPQAAILAVGATVQRYVGGPDSADWKPIAEFTLTCDHRALDGATGAKFAGALKQHLEAGIVSTSTAAVELAKA
jgi:hypothetical protein